MEIKMTDIIQHYKNCIDVRSTSTQTVDDYTTEYLW